MVTAAALVAAVVVFTFFALPPRPIALDTSWRDGAIRGVIHIHTNRSDGLSSPDEIAAAAARAGLAFIVFTDHGDATRTPDPPTYRSGVLCLDGVEISTSNGHYVVLGMDAAPYPLGGEARDVVEDVRRLGGFGIAAHPDSPKTELSWTAWDTPIDGLELVNPDTSWRVHVLEGGWAAGRRLVPALLTYPVRASETMGRLLTESPALVHRWQQLTANRRVVSTAGADAHAKLELRAGEVGQNGLSLPVPGYESSFRMLSVHVVPTEPLTGDAPADATRVLSAIRNGHLYSTIDSWAAPAQFEFTATNATGTARPGDEMKASGPLTLQVRSNAPAAFHTSIWRDGEAILNDQPGPTATVTSDDRPAVYRAEIRSAAQPGAPAWVTSNPIYVRADRKDPTPAVAAVPPASPRKDRSLFDGRTAAGWSRESDAQSLSDIEAVLMTSGMELRLRFGLLGGADLGQFAGAAAETSNGVAASDRLAFTIRGERPMRLSIQVRAELKDAPPERWQRSIYLDETDREQTIFFADMAAVGITHTPRAPLADVRAIMFIVDTTNTNPGASGRIWIRNVRLQGPAD